MRRIILFAIVAFMPSSAGLAQMRGQAPSESSPNEQEVRDAFTQFSDAFVKADTIVLRSLLADDYVHTNADGGVLDKTRWLAFAKTRHEDLQSGRVRIDTYRNDDLRIRVYGNTAVVTGRNTTIGVRDGQAWKMNLRFTNVWVKREGRWQRAAFHDSNAMTQ
ncbi:nuclear transport factor 2 family protein [candidate division KSB1 bacterium]|nr:nuclear transport factor 2 family protein [candidate division KSB1 bacterium]